VAETVDEALRLTRAAESWTAAGDRSLQAVANLEKLEGMARAFDAEESATLGGFVRWAQAAAAQAAEAESLPAEEGDAVRIMSIHAAKGLEFPVVILAMAGARGQSGARRRVLVDREARTLACAFAVPGATSDSRGREWLGEVATAGFERHHRLERQHEESERVRLLYVAATRACDRLLIPVFEEPRSGSLIESLTGRLAPDDDGEVDRIPLPSGPARRPAAKAALPAAEALLKARDGWLQDRDLLLEAASRPLAVTSPSRLEELADEGASAGEAGERAGARVRALALGTAVHAVMERASLVASCERDAAREIEALAMVAAREAGDETLAGRIAELALACWRSAPVREAAGADEVYRELPFCVFAGRPPGLSRGSADTVAARASKGPSCPLLEGFCDLVYRLGAGWVVVDYKTDADPDEALVRRRYGPQGGAYALAVQQVTGGPVVRVSFVLAAGAADGEPAPSIDIPVTQELLEQADAMVLERAVAPYAVAQSVV